jgi:hypothetical protein
MKIFADRQATRFSSFFGRRKDRLILIPAKLRLPRVGSVIALEGPPGSGVEYAQPGGTMPMTSGEATSLWAARAWVVWHPKAVLLKRGDQRQEACEPCRTNIYII